MPRLAGVLSALGMLLADVTRDYSLTVLQPSDEADAAWLERRFEPLVEAARAGLAAEGFEGERASIERSLDVRYVGQSFRQRPHDTQVATSSGLTWEAAMAMLLAYERWS